MRLLLASARRVMAPCHLKARCGRRLNSTHLFQHPKMESHLANIVKRHNELAAEVEQLSINGSDTNAIARKSRALARSSELVSHVATRQRILQDKAELQALAVDDDAEMANMATQELLECDASLAEEEQHIVNLLLPEDDADTGNAVLEIRAGTGGKEAAFFAGDLAVMYQGLARRMRWKPNVVSMHETDEGGTREVSITISGAGAFGFLKFESGVHRVQRVPTTEIQGRIHTSTATVAVLPEPSEVDVQVLDKDLKIETFRAGGAGGQHVNTTDSAVRITHVPTGTVVACQNERSQHKNRAAALKILKARIFAEEHRKAEEQRRLARQSQISINPGQRSDRIRTYNVPQDRVTDHRIKFSMSGINGFLAGETINEMINQLQTVDNVERLSDLLSDGQQS